MSKLLYRLLNRDWLLDLLIRLGFDYHLSMRGGHNLPTRYSVRIWRRR